MSAIDHEIAGHEAEVAQCDPELMDALVEAQELGLISDVGVAAWVAGVSVEAVAQMSPLGGRQLVAFSKNVYAASSQEFYNALSPEMRSRLESMDQIERGRLVLELWKMWQDAQVDKILQRELARSGKRNSSLNLMITIHRMGLHMAARTARVAAALNAIMTFRPPPPVVVLPWLSPKTSPLGIASPPRLLPGRALAEAF